MNVVHTFCEETAKRAIRELSGTLLDGCTITLQSLADVPTYLWQHDCTDGLRHGFLFCIFSAASAYAAPLQPVHGVRI